MLDLSVYYDNGVFQRQDSTQTVAWFDPDYHLESIIYQEKDGAASFFRTLHSFTPPAEREIWGGRVETNTPRTEELYRNLVKVVVLSTCDQKVGSRLRDYASATKLGQMQVNLQSKSLGSEKLTYAFESTTVIQQAAPISYYPTTEFPYSPVDYGNGTLAL